MVRCPLVVRHGLAAVALVALLTASASAILPHEPEGLAPGAAARLAAPPFVVAVSDPEWSRARALADPAWKHFLSTAGGTWHASWDQRTDRVAMATGAGLAWPVPEFGDGSEAAQDAGLDVLERAARAFALKHAALFRVPDGVTLVRDDVRSVALADGRTWQLVLQPHVGDVPVEAGALTFRTSRGRLVQFGLSRVSDALALAPRAPELTGSAATERALQEVAETLVGIDADDGEVVESPRLSLRPWPTAAGGLDYRLTWTTRVRIPGRIETWQVVIDATDGSRLALHDANAYACPPPAQPQGRVVGGVYLGAIEEVPESLRGMPFTAVTHGTDVTTDYNGTFPFAAGVTASTTLSGTFFDMECVTCTNPAQASASTPAWGRLSLGTGGPDATGNGLSTRAERNCFYHLGVVRQLATKHLTNAQVNDWFDRLTPAEVNIPASCNAGYSPGGNSLHFFRSGGPCNNTGEIADVMQHEWGHGLDDFSGGGMDGARGEGIGDVVAFLSTHDPRLGPYFFRGDGGGIRNADENASGVLSVANVGARCPVDPNGGNGPLGTEVHCEGQIFSQAWWHLARNLRAKYGEVAGWHATERLFFQSLRMSDTFVPGSAGSTYNAVVAVDDDNGNLADGTPNGAEINEAFSHHGMDETPNVGDSADCVPLAAPVVTLTNAQHPDTGQWQVGVDWTGVAGATQYLVVRNDAAGTTADVPLAVVLAPVTEFFDDDVTDDVTYRYRVIAFGANGCLSTADNRQQITVAALPSLSMQAHSTDETDPANGNGNGVAEPGERLVVTADFANTGSIATTGTIVTLTTAHPGITILDGDATLPDLLPGGVARTAAPHFLVGIDPTVRCGDVVAFDVAAESAEGCSFGGFSVRIGVPSPTVLVEDDLETDTGWLVDADGTDTATTGVWTLANPNGTNAQTQDDHTANPGVRAWITGNSAADLANPGNDDVDGGCTSLLSPTWDMGGQPGLLVSYWRWFEMRTSFEDALLVEISNDGGGAWQVLERVSQPATAWVQATFDLDAVLGAAADRVALRFTVCDTGPGSLLEAAVDDVAFTGFDCEPPQARPRLAHVASSFDDTGAGGNANGGIDPGETVALHFDARNGGNASALRVRGQVSIVGAPAGTSLPDADGSWLDVATDATGRSVAGGGFTLQVPLGAACGDTIQLALRVTYDGPSGTSYETLGTATFVVGRVIETVAFVDDFDIDDNGFTSGANCTNPGCNDWQRAAPMSASPFDPPSAFSNLRAWGNDLGPAPRNGNYRANTINWLESRTIDCSALTGARLGFQRWLSVEDGANDHARILVNGTLVWQNPSGADLLDTAWTWQEYDISALADGNPAVVVRFEMESDPGLEYGGWTLDDMKVFSSRTICEPIGCAAPPGPPAGIGPFLRATGRKDQDGAEFSWVGAPLDAAGGESFRLVRGTAPDAVGLVLTPGTFTAFAHDDRTAPGALYFYLLRRENCRGEMSP